MRYMFGAILLAMTADAQPTVAPSIAGVPGPLEWHNTPRAWKIEEGRLKIEAGRSTDWYISPQDGKDTHSAPILLFKPDQDFVLTAKVDVEFRTKWDAGMFMVFVDDKTWAKLAFEMAVYNEPTIVSVVTRGVSDDCNSSSFTEHWIWLRIAKAADAIGFYVSRDGRSWRMVRAFTFGSVKELRVGFGAQSPAGEGASAVFSEIRYELRKIQDLAVGQ